MCCNATVIVEEDQGFLMHHSMWNMPTIEIEEYQ